MPALARSSTNRTKKQSVAPMSRDSIFENINMYFAREPYNYGHYVRESALVSCAAAVDNVPRGAMRVRARNIMAIILNLCIY